MSLPSAPSLRSPRPFFRREKGEESLALRDKGTLAAEQKGWDEGRVSL